jgi:hypothetical protein
VSTAGDRRSETLKRISAIVAAAALTLSLSIPNRAHAGGIDQPQICDVGADYSLGIEDYPDAIRRHLDIVRAHPEDALAHYHLGFAFGMLGDRTSELREYRQAKALGLRAWDFFLNLGLAHLSRATSPPRPTVSEPPFSSATIIRKRISISLLLINAAGCSPTRSTRRSRRCS